MSTPGAPNGPETLRSDALTTTTQAEIEVTFARFAARDLLNLNPNAFGTILADRTSRSCRLPIRINFLTRPEPATGDP